jgi:hypothetical protein
MQMQDALKLLNKCCEKTVQMRDTLKRWSKCDDGATDAITLKRLSKCCDADAITLKRWSKCNIWAFQIREERGTLKRVTVLLVTRCCFLRDAATTSFKIAGSPEQKPN